MHSIMSHVAEKMDLPLEDLYRDIAWPLYTKYGHAYDAFKLAITCGPFEVGVPEKLDAHCFFPSPGNRRRCSRGLKCRKQSGGRSLPTFGAVSRLNQ